MVSAQARLIRVVSSVALADVETEASRTIAAAPAITADTLAVERVIPRFAGRRTAGLFTICFLL
jgi:hypothetical protein